MRMLRSGAMALQMILAALLAWEAASAFAQAAEAQPAAAGAPATREEIAALIRQLGDAEFVVRERAQKRLLAIGFEAFDALKEAEQDDDIEIATRALYLTQRIGARWVREEDPAEVQAIFRNYGEADDSSRIAQVTKLLRLSGERGVPSVCRIVRFEKSPAVSKEAAAALLEMKPSDEAAWRKRADVIRAALGGSTRPGARWLEAQLLSLQDPQAALAAWNLLIDEERGAAAEGDHADRRRLVILLRRRIALFKQLDRPADAVAEVARLVELGEQDPETIGELVEWLEEEQAWKVLDELAIRFRELFEQNAKLAYRLAITQAKRGDEARAEELATQAAKQSALLQGRFPVNERSMEVYAYIQLAEWLKDRGRYAWAERELRQFIAQRKPPSLMGIHATRRLAEMLHDGAEEQKAADELAPLVKGTVLRKMQEINIDPSDVKARYHFFVSLAAAARNDLKAQRAALKDALKASAEDADVLIALYQSSANEPAERADAVKKIEAAAESYRRAIEQEPNEYNNYNQFAWLIGNTEGDLEEAVRFSHRSIELLPASTSPAGFLDTLAHCYFTKGDLENAVKYQRQAVDLEPNTRVLSRELERFKKALAEKK